MSNYLDPGWLLHRAARYAATADSFRKKGFPLEAKMTRAYARELVRRAEAILNSSG